METRWTAAGTCLAAVVVLGVADWYRSATEDRPARGKEDGPEAAVRKTAAAYVKVFNASDVKGLAALWAKEGQYTGPEGRWCAAGRQAVGDRDGRDAAGRARDRRHEHPDG